MLHRESGALVTRRLPTLKLYKIGVKLDMTGNTAADAKAEVLEHERPERREHMDAPELSDLEIATIRVVQEDLPLVERPFAAYGELIGCDEATVLELLRVVQGAQAHAPLRRGDEPPVGRASRPTRWACGRSPTTQLDEIGPQMAGFALVSHCYRRPDLRRLAVLDLHDGARQERQGLRGDHRRDPRRDRRRRVRARSGRSRSTRRPACATSRTTGTTGAPRTSRRRLSARRDRRRAASAPTRPAAATSSTSTTRARRCPPPRRRRHRRSSTSSSKRAIGGYAAADAVADAVGGGLRLGRRRCVGADADEIALVENATRAWDMAFYALARRSRRVTGSSRHAPSMRAT